MTNWLWSHLNTLYFAIRRRWTCLAADATDSYEGVELDVDGVMKLGAKGGNEAIDTYVAERFETYGGLQYNAVLWEEFRRDFAGWEVEHW